DRAARALFAATEMVNPNKYEAEFGRSVPQNQFGAYLSRYQTRLIAQLNAWQLIGGAVIRDPWGSDLRVDRVNNSGDTRYYMVRSAGPDKRLFDADDLAAYVQVRSQKVSQQGPPGTGTLELDVEHDRGPFNGLAEVSGSVVDPEGANIPGAVV